MRKAILSVTAAVTATVTASIAVSSAAKRYSASDLGKMRDSLLGRSPVLEGQDINDDGSVDVFDYIRMGRELAPSGAFTKSSFAAAEENVKYTGRYYYDDKDVLWLVQSGSAVEFNVNARSAEVTIHGDSGINHDPDHRPRYAVVIDGKVTYDATVGKSEEKITIFSGDAPRTANVKIIHLSEAVNGAVGVGRIETDSDSASPISPAAEKSMRIEFIGDSITCGYGVEGASQNESFKTTTENFMKTYAYLAAEKLNADYSAVSYSGYGVVSGYTSNGTRASEQLVPTYYEQIGSLKEYSKPWDFSSKPNDVVVINLGTNDSTYIAKDPENRGREFIELYEKFLETVRRNNPDAYIICTLGIMGASDEYPMIQQAIEDFKKATGDERITSYKAPLQSSADGYGSDWHPSAATQQKNADILAEKICQVLGLDAAER